MTKTLLIYEDVLSRVRAEIDKRWGGVEKFLDDTKSLKESGILQDETAKPSLRVYLSVPAKGGMKKVKSLPVMAKLYQYLFDEELHFETEVKRTTLIWVEQ